MESANKFVAIAFTVVAFGCTSIQERAEKSFKDGEFIAAATLYEQILSNDSKDGVAKERLQKSRQKIIENRLIEVRQQRLSDDFEGAIKKLAAIISDENKWETSPGGAAFSTQLEEMNLLYSWVEDHVKAELKSGKILKAKFFNDKFKDIFSIGATRKRQDELIATIIKHGVEQCLKLGDKGQGYYSQEFAKKYCMFWGAKDTQFPNRMPASSQNLQRETYGSMVLSGNIANLPKEVLSNLSERLLDGLKSTPYYLAGSGPLKMNISGKYSGNYTEQSTIKVHSYEVKIPYQVAIKVPYEVSIPYTAYEPEYYFENGMMKTKTVRVTRVRTEVRYRNDTETRYRSESRSLKYPATDFALTYLLVGKSSFKIDGSNHELPMNNQLEVVDSFYDTDNSEIGLSAKKKNTVSAVDWLKESFSGLDKELTTRIEKAWESKYCKVPDNMMSKTQIETVMKCLKGSSNHHDFVDNWFKATFGMSYDEVCRVIGLSA